VRQRGEIVHLTPTEFDLLVGLAERPGRVLTRERLLVDVWGYRDGSGARTVDSHVRALRRKLGDGVVRTVHGVGYALGEQGGDAGDAGDGPATVPDADADADAPEAADAS
jgi:DNA-binding response OmpR family regulator